MKSLEFLRSSSQRVDAEVSSINLMAREGDARDIPAWLELYRTRSLLYPAANWDILPEMWKSLLDTGRLLLFVVEDRSRPLLSRFVSCCAAIFVTDAFCEEAKKTLSPCFGVELTQLHLAQKLPLLTRGMIAEENAGRGLNVMICFESWREGAISSQQALAVREKQGAALHLALSGYRIKELLANPLDHQSFQQWIDGGARLRRDGGEGFRSDWKNLRPRIVGLTNEEAEAHPGSHLSSLFVYNRPRFSFSRAEQKLLQHALTGETCQGLAAGLGLSAWTVKKRWHSIYARVTAIDSEILPPPIAEGPDAHSRGLERRRRLLNYLRQHPEELRPYRSRIPRLGLVAHAFCYFSLLASSWNPDFLPA